MSFPPAKAEAVKFNVHQIKQTNLFFRRDAMPIYISRGRFTSEAVKGMLAKPENREEAVAKLFKSVGGKLIGWYLTDRKSTRLNSSHANISYAVFCLKKKKKKKKNRTKIKKT